MFKVKVTPNDLGRRLDPNYYSPDALGQIHLLKASGLPVQSVEKAFPRRNSGPFGSSLLSSAYVSKDADSVIFFRPVDCKDMVANCDNENVFISPQDNKRLASSSFKGGSIILTKIGNSIGDVSVVPESIPICNISGNMMGMDPDITDPYFQSAFLRSRVGQFQIHRGVIGGPMPKIDMESIGEILLPTPHPDVQSYIGGKVRKAEAVGAKAHHLLHEMNTFFRGLYIRKSESWRGNWRRDPASLTEGRLDSWYYAPEPTDLERSLMNLGAHRLGLQAKLIKKCLFHKDLAIQYFEIGELDVSTGCAWPSLVHPNEIPSRAQRSIRPWDILVSTVRPERKNVGLIPDTYDGQLVASTGFAVLRADSANLAGFLWGYLRSDAGSVQLLRWNTGAAYPAIDDEVPLSIYIPDYPHEEMEAHGAQWRRTPVLLFYSRQLTTTARLLIEALIEKKITEEELIAAYKDPAKDRDLLSRLTAKGIDVPDETPLFPDLDVLFELLSEKDNQEVA